MGCMISGLRGGVCLGWTDWEPRTDDGSAPSSTRQPAVSLRWAVVQADVPSQNVSVGPVGPAHLASFCTVLVLLQKCKAAGCGVTCAQARQRQHRPPLALAGEATASRSARSRWPLSRVACARRRRRRAARPATVSQASRRTNRAPRPAAAENTITRSLVRTPALAPCALSSLPTPVLRRRRRARAADPSLGADGFAPLASRPVAGLVRAGRDPPRPRTEEDHCCVVRRSHSRPIGIRAAGLVLCRIIRSLGGYVLVWPVWISRPASACRPAIPRRPRDKHALLAGASEFGPLWHAVPTRATTTR